MSWADIKQKAQQFMPKKSNEDLNSHTWFVEFVIKAIHAVSTEQDRLEILSWLALVREILEQTELSTKEKLKHIYMISDSKATVKIMLNSIETSVKNYKNADLPLAIKIAIPVTLAAATVVGGSGAGIAALGGAIGVPILLLVFLGTAGITAILESFMSSSDAQNYISVVMSLIVRDEIYRRANKSMQAAMIDQPVAPKKSVLPKNEENLRQKLLVMDAFEFEQHVMSFFQDAGLLSWVTKQSNDAGVDGFAKHTNGLIVVQCKRYSQGNLVGRPLVQQFKGVVEENQAWRGYIVTTSQFTKDAKESAVLNEKLILVDLDSLVQWHLHHQIEGLLLQ